MKHRSPLVTLAAVAVAFVIMFTVNLLSGPPGGSSTGTAAPSAAPATAGATSPSSQPSETAVTTPSARASENAQESKFPNKVVYAGRTEDKSGALAVAVLGDQAAAGVPPHWNSYVSVDDVDAASDAVNRAGGTVVAAPFGKNASTRACLSIA